MLQPTVRLASFVIFILSLSAGCLAAAKPNIILITLDSVRADHVGFLDAKHSTPNLDVLAKQSIIFERAYAQAPLTIVSDATILSGTYPQTHAVNELGSPLPASVPWLPEALRARGYQSAAFVGSVFLDPRKGFAPGFDRGFDVYDASGRAAQMLHVVARLTGKQNEPFFLWLNLAQPGASGYKAGISSADNAIGKVLDVLRSHNLYDDAIIVVVADHGESLGAHGEDTHGIFLYDETIHVPLLLKLPANQLAGKRVSARVRALDIAPTVLEAAGIPVPSQMQGQSLLRIAKAAGNTELLVYSRSDFPHQAFGWSALESWRTGKYLYTRAPKPELYDVSADPGATHNLAQSSKAIAQTLAAQLDGFDKHFSPAKNGETQLTSTEMQKLASLGYVGIQKSQSANATVEGTDPKDTVAIANETLIAVSDLQEGKFDKAIGAFQQVLAKQTNIYLAQYGLGRALSQKQRYAEAVEHLHKAIELQPDSTWANFEIGRALIKAGDFTTAAVHLEIAANRMPEFAHVHALLAEAYDKLGRKNDADRERVKGSRKP
jgi:arylsulfatase A-like enzyme